VKVLFLFFPGDSVCVSGDHVQCDRGDVLHFQRIAAHSYASGLVGVGPTSRDVWAHPSPCHGGVFDVARTGRGGGGGKTNCTGI
jgi:hypothetical protein